MEAAIKYFAEAREKAPRASAPNVHFNLALATDKVGGRELIAIPWYRAYLAAAANADNVGQVRNRITELEVAVEGNVRRLLEWSNNAANKLLYGKYAPHITQASARKEIAKAQFEIGDMAGAVLTASGYSYSYLDFVEAQLIAGDIDGAGNMAARIESGLEIKVVAFATIAEAALEAGNRSAARQALSRAKAAASRIEYDNYMGKHTAYSHLGRAQAKYGDMSGARKSFAEANGVTNSQHWQESFFNKHVMRIGWYGFVAETQAEVGNAAGARETIALAAKEARQISEGNAESLEDKSAAYADLGVIQAKVGDRAAARRSFDLAERLAARITEAIQKSNAYEELAQGLVKSGDLPRAMKLIPNINRRDETYRDIVNAHIKAGDITGAKAVAALMKGSVVYIGSAYENLVKALAESGEFDEARKWAERIPKDKYTLDDIDRSHAAIARAQAKARDIAAARISVARITSVDVKFRTYRKVAEIQEGGGRSGAVGPNAVIDHWIALAERNSRTPLLADFPGFVRNIKTKKDPEEIVEAFVKSQTATYHALRELQAVAAYWQKGRAPTRQR